MNVHHANTERYMYQTDIVTDSGGSRVWRASPPFSGQRPSILYDTFRSQNYSHKSYPNIMTVLHILAVTPVTVATTERANSALKHILTPKRSGMTEPV